MRSPSRPPRVPHHPLTARVPYGHPTRIVGRSVAQRLVAQKSREQVRGASGRLLAGSARMRLARAVGLARRPLGGLGSASAGRFLGPGVTGGQAARRSAAGTAAGAAHRGKMPRGVKKENLPQKVCVTCGRPFTWRKKWERCWDEVTTCSKSCNAKRRKAKGSDGGSLSAAEQ